MLGFLKKLFSWSSAQPAEEEYAMEPEFQTKPCRSCGRPISYNPEWKHIPNYCRECKKEYRAGLLLVSIKLQSRYEEEAVLCRKNES